MATNLKWRRGSSSANNYDLTLTTPERLDSGKVLDLLHRIGEVTHRGLSLSGRADRELRRWAEHPATSLRSDAYVLLSNWFSTNSGDRRSVVASRCEDLWDYLFACRPPRRLSSPEPGKNHAIVPTEFWKWWGAVLVSQGEEVPVHQTEAIETDNGQREWRREASPNHSEPPLSLSIAEAKAALARTFGVTPDKVEIVIRG